MLIGRRHTGGNSHNMACVVFKKSSSGKPHHPAGVGGTKEPAVFLLIMSLAVITVVLPVMTAVQHHETKMGRCEAGNNGLVTESAGMNSEFVVPFINGGGNVHLA